MSQTLQAMIQGMVQARTQRELHLQFMDKAGELFGAHHWGIYLTGTPVEPATVELKGLPDHFVNYYQESGLAVDPVMQYIIETHAPAHEELILTEDEWKQSVLYREGCGKQYDHEHILAGPIVAKGQLIGTLHFARPSGTPAFDSRDLSHLSALCAHFSVCLALLQAQTNPSLEVTGLTKRELQIAQLVARGLTNAEIGRQLWITQNSVKQALKRIFRKLRVSARAEMVARLGIVNLIQH